MKFLLPTYKGRGTTSDLEVEKKHHLNSREKKIIFAEESLTRGKYQKILIRSNFIYLLIQQNFLSTFHVLGYVAVTKFKDLISWGWQGSVSGKRALWLVSNRD